MNMKKPQEPEINLETKINLVAEYRRLSENEKIYHEKIKTWRDLEKLGRSLGVISMVLFFLAVYWFSETAPFFEPLAFIFLIVFSILFIASLILFQISSWKFSRIESELGLPKAELLYLRVYDTYKNVDSYLKESNIRRKPYFRKSALKNAEEAIEIVNDWEYGNIKLVKRIIGDQIDLLKNNLERLVLSNIVKGDDTTLTEVSKMLLQFCEYINSSSVKELEELNDAIKELPYVEYKVATTRQRLTEHFYGKPRAFRLLFASIITIIVVSVLLYLNESIGLMVAVGVACFWGAFTGFDKLFRLEKK